MITEDELRAAEKAYIRYSYAGSCTLHREGECYKRENGTLISITDMARLLNLEPRPLQILLDK